jgi:hypothetical protein
MIIYLVTFLFRFYEEYSMDKLDEQNFYHKLLALKKEQEEHLKLGNAFIVFKLIFFHKTI